jgi:hypothetical protein
MANAINLNQTGVVAYNNTTGVFFGRTLTSTGSTVTITNPNGVVGNPNFEVNLAGININSFTGILSVTNGGTSASTFPTNNILIGNGSGPIGSIPSGTNGQLLIGATGGPAAFSTLALSGGLTQTQGANTLTLTAPPITITGSGVTVTGSPVSLGGAVTLTVTGGGITWVNVTATTQAMAVNTGYVANNAAQVVFTLPATATLGDTLYVTGNGNVGTAGWKINQNAGQVIFFGSSTTTVGASGSLTSTNQLDSVHLVAVTSGASTVWNVIGSIGNITVV